MGAGFLFTIERNSLYRGSLYQGLSVFVFHLSHFVLIRTQQTTKQLTCNQRTHL